MKYLILFFLLGSFSAATQAQNIVPNPNFMLYDTCPNSFSQINFSRYWYQVTTATPDFYHSCNNVTTYHNFGVPVNVFGNQNAPGGAYAGIYNYATSSGGYKEYFGTDIPALAPGAIYKVSLRVVLAEYSHLASNGLGVFFYKDAKPDSMTYFVLPVTPQIDYSSYGILSDTVNWVTLTANFTADSTYTHLVVGGFKDDTDILLDTVSSASIQWDSYYFIDSVAVEMITPASVGSVSNVVNISVHPNPFSDFTTLSFSNPGRKRHSLSVFSISGSLVCEINGITGDEVRIERNDLPKGLYYYKLTNEYNKGLYGKLVID